MDTKSLTRVEIKDADKGHVSAVFSTFDVVDLDGDVTRKGAFTDGAPVVISAYGHTSWDGELPVGKGTIRQTDTEAILEGRFFVNTSHGRDAFETVKELSEDGLQEWSYSLHNIRAEKGEFDGREVRFLNKIDVKEVSPVLKGAGVNTRTLRVKSSKFYEQKDIALGGVDELVEMAVERLARRAAEGKSIDEQVAEYVPTVERIQGALARWKSAIDSHLTPPPTDDDVRSVLALIGIRNGVLPR